MKLGWILFDLNGTLLDPGGIGAPMGLGDESSSRALEQAVLLAMAETLSGSYRPLPDLLRGALERRAAADGGDPAGLEEALQRAGCMPAYPDAAAAIETLRRAGLEVGVLTNSPRDGALAALEAAGILDGLSLVAGTDEVSRFKPHPDVYRLGVIRAGALAEEVCMVAAHAWDLMGAGRAGLQTAWVNRDGGPWLAGVPEPAVQGESLEAVCKQLAAVS